MISRSSTTPNNFSTPNCFGELSQPCSADNLIYYFIDSVVISRQVIASNMPGGNFRDESLEARIERIRERDEEIEKKHREAEADRLAALQANAMVRTTAPKDDDWPKAHKYDKIDFTYDVKTDDADDANKKTGSVLSRNYKKFPEGQGPPADPTYNFLADAERDGTTKNGPTSGDSEKKDWRASCTGGHLNRRGNNNNNSFNKGRNNGKGKGTAGSGKFQQRNNVDGEYSTWKNERERIDESRVNRQKSDEGKWRREWDSEKSVAQDATIQSKATSGNVAAMKATNAPDSNARNAAAESMPKDAVEVTKADESKVVNQLPQKFNELNVEKRGNITVSISQDGEVKSVKCEYSVCVINFTLELYCNFAIFPRSGINACHWDGSCRQWNDPAPELAATVFGRIE